MGVDHLNSWMPLDELQRMIRRICTATIQNSAIGRAGITVYGGGWIRIEDGGLQVTGTASVSGRLEGSGTFDWTGPMNLKGAQSITGPTTFTGQMTVNGPWSLNGNGSIAGTVVIDGATTLNSTLTISSGQIRAGAVTITPTGGGQVQIGSMSINGANGGTLSSSGTIYTDAPLRVTGSMTASSVLSLGTVQGAAIKGTSLDISGAKSFRMPHPLKDGVWLRHGSTESPVSGTEYTGKVRLGVDGVATVKLPDYFEALNKPEGRSVQVTPVGRPFLAGADPVVDGVFKVYGEAGRELCWLVKAERYGGDFLLEEPVDPDEPTTHAEESIPAV